jgi:hypothetical protein
MFPVIVREIDLISLRWSEKKFWRSRVYRHLAPSGAKATMFCLQVEFANRKEGSYENR